MGRIRGRARCCRAAMPSSTLRHGGCVGSFCWCRYDRGFLCAWGSCHFLGGRFFSHKSYGDCWSNKAMRSEILNVLIGDVPLSLCGSFQFDDTAWYGKKTKRSWRAWRRLTACCLKGGSICSLLWLGQERGNAKLSLWWRRVKAYDGEGFPELQSAVTSVSVWMGGVHWIYYISRSSQVRVPATTRIRQVPQGYLPLALSDQFWYAKLAQLTVQPSSMWSLYPIYS